MTTKLDLRFDISQDGDFLVSYDGGCTWEIVGHVRGIKGDSPHIDATTGNWFVGDEDTGVPAQGPKGEDGIDGEEGAEGPAPYISEDGFWVVDGEKTTIKAVGEYTTIVVDSSGIAGTGTPSIVPTRNGSTVTLAFNNLKGVKGDKGDTGVQGPVGPQGNEGEKGDPGDGIHFTEHNNRYECLAPNYAYTTADGDLMVRLTEEGAELPTPEGVDPYDYFDQNVQFVNLGNLKGPQGYTGPQGPQGPPIYFTTEGSYDTDLQRAIFNVDGANPGDYLVYIGEDTTVAPIGQLFRLSDGLDDWDRQIWVDQNFSIRGPKGDVLNAEGLIPSLRLVDVLDQDYPPMSYQKLQASFDGFQNIIELGVLRCRSIRTIYQISGLQDEETYYTFRVEYTDGTNYDLKIKPNGTGRNGRGYIWTEATNSFAEGEATGDPDPSQPLALGSRSHAEGKSTIARGTNSHAEGLRRNAFGAFSHAEGASQSDTDSIEVDTIEEEELTSFEAVSLEPYKVDIQIDNGSGDPSIYEYKSILLFYRENYTNPSDQVVITEYESNTEDDVTTITLTLDKKVADLSDWSITGGNKITLCTPPQDKALAYGVFSHVEGFNTSAIGIGSHAEGDTTIALGDYAHAEGEACKALGDRAHAEGDNTKAYGFASHTEGKKTEAYSLQSHAEGNESKAIRQYSHAEGNKTTASGISSHAEGEKTTASGNKAHAEGNEVTASGASSHAEGSATKSSGDVSHAEGKLTTAFGSQSHAEGLGTRTSTTITAVSHGVDDTIVNISASNSLFAPGVWLEYNNVLYLIKEVSPQGTTLTLDKELTIVADKVFTIYNGVAYGPYSHSEGLMTVSYGEDAHSEGYNTYAIGNHSHAEGKGTNASGTAAHAEGIYTEASGTASLACGQNTVAYSNSQTVVGEYNVIDTQGKYAFIVGNGTSSSRSNAFAIGWDGSLVLFNSGTPVVMYPSDLASLLAQLPTP